MRDDGSFRLQNHKGSEFVPDKQFGAEVVSSLTHDNLINDIVSSP
jgi:hypothetical protein